MQLCKYNALRSGLKTRNKTCISNAVRRKLCTIKKEWG